jgi:hypothetical protein
LFGRAGKPSRSARLLRAHPAPAVIVRTAGAGAEPRAVIARLEGSVWAVIRGSMLA